MTRSDTSLSRRDFLASLAVGTSAIFAAGAGDPCVPARGSLDVDALNRHIAEELGTEPFPIPGAVVLIGTPKEVLFHEAVGLAQVAPTHVPMQRDSIFDVASVTKVVATATACAICVDRGLLDPDAPLTKYLPEHRGQGVEKISLRRLASHTSGFRESPRLFKSGNGDALFAAMLQESPQYEVNTHYEYACRNIILLSTVIQRVAKRSFGEFCQQEIFAPLGMNDSRFNTVPPSPRVVGTQYPQLGVSHNDDTRAAGRAIGNAGLFTTASDLARFCQMMLRGGTLDGNRILSPKVIAEFTKPNQLPQFRQHGFIWMTGDEPHRPKRLSSQAYGHGGYTGQSMWIDPGKGVFSLVLSNRTHPKDLPGSKEKQYAKLGRIGDRVLQAVGM